MDKLHQTTNKNKRKTTRFIRNDIKASIINLRFLGLRQAINCKLIDISSTGVQISTPVKLSVNTKLTLILQFDDGKEFKLKSKLARHKETNHYFSNHSFPTIKNLSKINDASLRKLHFFESNKQIFAKYRNLSSSGVNILTYSPLNIKKQHSLLFTLSNGKKHKAITKIDQYQHYRYYNYGIKFDKTNDELGEHILETQTDLIFK